MAKLRIAVITDIHYGIDVRAKLGSKAPRLMKGFVKAANDYAPDLVVDMGDRVVARSNKNEDDDRYLIQKRRNRAEDARYMYELKQHFNKIAAPLHSVIGNHDEKNLSRSENARIMGTPETSYSRDMNGYHLVFWNPKTSQGITGGLEIDDKDIEWLEQDINKTKKPTVLFSHVPLTNGPELANENHDIAGRFYLEEVPRIRSILEKAGNVILCMGGHLHRNQHREVNGIHYITQQSLTHAWKKHYRVPSGAYSFVELDDNKISFRLRGKVRKHHKLQVRQAP